MADLFSGAKLGAAFLAASIGSVTTADERSDQGVGKDKQANSAPLNPGKKTESNTLSVVQNENMDELSALRVPGPGILSRLKNLHENLHGRGNQNNEASVGFNQEEKFSHIPQHIKDLAHKLGHPFQTLKQQGKMWTACPDDTACIVIGPHELKTIRDEDKLSNRIGCTYPDEVKTEAKALSVVNGKFGPVPQGAFVHYETAKSDKGSFPVSLSPNAISETRPGIGKIERVPGSNDLVITVDPSLKKLGVVDAQSCIHQVKPLLTEIKADFIPDVAQREKLIAEAVKLFVQQNKNSAILMVISDPINCPPCTKLEPQIEAARSMLEKAGQTNALILSVPVNLKAGFGELYKGTIPSVSVRASVSFTEKYGKSSPPNKLGLVPEAFGDKVMEGGPIESKTLPNGKVLTAADRIVALMEQLTGIPKK